MRSPAAVTNGRAGLVVVLSADAVPSGDGVCPSSLEERAFPARLWQRLCAASRSEPGRRGNSPAPWSKSLRRSSLNCWEQRKGGQ